ncbi:helix-turn-helix domain-containing protein [Nocardia abscessus]|uniref:helix-turn-helix domain-containing protein n=1 Tax=Nocardia abscessus TaxID=120957 RepID=UPI0024545221|nr:helix-turn-helix transcriptional regulator [Nocardia abscessus]
MEISASVQHYGTTLRRCRRSREWSQVELAKRAGMSKNTISRLENGEREPRMGQIVALAEALAVPAHEFLPDTTQGSQS